MNKEKIRFQDTLEVISGVASEPETWRMAWDFVRQNWDILYKRYDHILLTQFPKKYFAHEKYQFIIIQGWFKSSDTGNCSNFAVMVRADLDDTNSLYPTC